jgi:hypothetical protein
MQTRRSYAISWREDAADGYRATLLVVHDGTRITVTSLDGPGALTELEHELRGRTEQPQSESATPSVSAV